MFYVALGSLAVAGIAITVFAGLLRASLRASARREDLLVNQLCSLAGKPWQPPPSREITVQEEDLERFLAIPERMPE